MPISVSSGDMIHMKTVHHWMVGQPGTDLDPQSLEDMVGMGQM